jgi:hypothetical protein
MWLALLTDARCFTYDDDDDDDDVYREYSVLCGGELLHVQMAACKTVCTMPM